MGRAGFTLMEIMIVLVIVIVLVTIAVPGILRSRVVANEVAALTNLRTLSRDNPPYIDNVLGSGTKQGYQFVYALVDPDHFTVNANPAHTGLLKGRYFSGTIRVNVDEPAGPEDEIIR